jgi:hypothetical protein
MHLKIDHSYGDCQRLKSEIDELRYLVNERSRKNAELQSELERERGLNDRRQNEIHNLSRDFDARQDVGVSMRKELEDIAYAIDQVREEKRRINEEQLYTERVHSDREGQQKNV